MTSDRERVLVTVEALASLIRDRADDLVVLHVGDNLPETGIAGAMPVDAGAFAGFGGGIRGARPLPEIDDLQRRVRSWGINPRNIVVLYDDKGGLQAARGWWVLRWAGLADVRLLDGGLGAWHAANLPLEPLANDRRTSDITLSPGHLPVLDADAAADFARRNILLDARGTAPFAGDPVAGTGGHIPGAISAPATGNLTADGHFHDVDTLKARYSALKVDGTAAVGVTCGSGVAAAHDIAALASIGVDGSLFPGSWSAWSADPDRPVAYGS